MLTQGKIYGIQDSRIPGIWTHDDNFVGGDLEVDDDSGDEIDEYRSRDNSVRYFKVPIVNEKAKSYYKLSNLSLAITKPPITKKMSGEE